MPHIRNFALSLICLFFVSSCADTTKGDTGSDDNEFVFDPDTCTGSLAGTQWYTVITEGLSDDSGMCTFETPIGIRIECDPGTTPDGYQPCSMMVEGTVSVDGTSIEFTETIEATREIGPWFGIEFQSGDQLAVAENVGTWTWIMYDEMEMSFNSTSYSIGSVCGQTNGFFMNDLTLVGRYSSTALPEQVWGDDFTACDNVPGGRQSVFDGYDGQFSNWMNSFSTLRTKSTAQRHKWWNERYTSVLPEGFRTVAWRNYGHALIDLYSSDQNFRLSLDAVERSYAKGNLNAAQALTFINSLILKAIERDQIPSSPF